MWGGRLMYRTTHMPMSIIQTESRVRNCAVGMDKNTSRIIVRRLHALQKELLKELVGCGGNW